MFDLFITRFIVIYSRLIAKELRLQLFKLAYIRRCVKLSSGIYFTQTKAINGVPQGSHPRHINSSSLFQLGETQTAEMHKPLISQLHQ